MRVTYCRTLIVLLGASLLPLISASSVAAQSGPGATSFKVDPFWPERLPNRWSMQQVTGIWVDPKTDHIWFLNRGANADGDEIGGDGNPPRIDCCVRGPEAIELDQAGKVVSSFGGPGFHPLWPTALQTIIVDREGNVWISGTAAQDSILKFSHDGSKLLWDFGHRPPKEGFKEDNQNTAMMVSKGRFNLDEDAREMYVLNQKRVLVYDMDTGVFKRGWGGHGMPLSEVTTIPSHLTNGRARRRRKKRTSCLIYTSLSSIKMASSISASAARIGFRFTRNRENG
jgi:hypothetical protein